MPQLRTCCTLAIVVGAIAGLASAGTIWYTVESSCGGSHLFSIDSVSKTITDRGTIRGMEYLTDIAMASDGTLYGVGWNNSKAAGNSSLYAITPGSAGQYATYRELDIKSNKLQNSVNALAWRDGTLYAASENGKFQTLSLNGNRWEVTNEGSLGFQGSSSGDLTFGADGRLYITLQGGLLATVKTDGSASQFGRTDVIGHTGYCDLFGLASVDGKLFGTTAASDFGKSYLVELNTQTGAASSPYALQNGVWGATSDPVPEPASLSLLVLGAGLLCLKRFRNSLPSPLEQRAMSKRSEQSLT